MVNPVMENQPYPEQYIPITLSSGRHPPPPMGTGPHKYDLLEVRHSLTGSFLPYYLKVVLFIQKLTEILENSEECRGTYELVPISGNDPHEISNVLIGMHNAANIEMHNPEANGVHGPEQGQL